MPLINPKATQLPTEIPAEPIAAAPEYKGTVVDTKYEPDGVLLTHVEGSAWTVDYYRQVLDKDSPLSGQNVTQEPIYQQYALIKELELRVSTPLTTSQDPNTKAMIVTGIANVYPFMIPNEGDMFLADIGDGKEGLFKVTQTERKSMMKEAVHVIEYQLIDYSTPRRRADLASKVIRRLHFAKDFLTYGQNPVLEEEDYALVKELAGRWGDLVTRYFHSFISNEYKTLVIPNQPYPVYDHFMTTACMAFFDTYDAPDLRYVRKLNVGGDAMLQTTTIWDVILERNLHMLKYCNRKAGLVSARTFEKNPMLDGIYHSGISYVVYPKDPEETVDLQIQQITKPIAEQTLLDAPSKVRSLADLIGDNVFEGLTKPDSPPIYKVSVDDYYVLSKEFYNNTSKQSLLERCVRDYIEGKAPNNRALLGLCNTYHAWGSLERFYYIPILLILVRASIRSI